jgi:signal transduction histidine kinase
MSLKTKIVTIVVASIVATVAVSMVSLFFDMNSLEKDIFQSTAQKLEQDAKDKTRGNVELAITTIEGILKKTPTADKIAKMKVSVVIEMMNKIYNENKDKMSE